MIGDALNVKVTIKDIDYNEYLEKNPGKRPFLFHRIYTLDDLAAAEAYVPATPLAEGLKKHTLALREKLGL